MIHDQESQWGQGAQLPQLKGPDLRILSSGTRPLTGCTNWMVLVLIMNLGRIVFLLSLLSAVLDPLYPAFPFRPLDLCLCSSLCL